MSACKHWVYTLFTQEDNGTAFTDLLRQLYDDDLITFAAHQLERCPESDRLHLQGTLSLPDKLRLQQVKHLLDSSRVRLAPRRGTPTQAFEYATKEATRADPNGTPFTVGTLPPPKGARTDLDEVRTILDEGGTMLDVADNHFGTFLRYHGGLQEYLSLRAAAAPSVRTLEVIWIHGKTGTGKSYYASTHWPTAYRPLLQEGGTTWFNGYTNHETIVLDDFTSSCVRLAHLLRWLDRYPLQVPSKRGSCYARWTRVVVTSNWPPGEVYCNVSQLRKAALLRRITETRTRASQDDPWVVTKVGG